jgi:APA family basic amino acid/polyamine antiporter
VPFPATEGDEPLKRVIGLPRATAMVVGTIIGASIFVQPSIVTGQSASVRGVLLVWAAAGALTLIGALVTAELASAFPRSGGVYVFLGEAWSPAVAYLWGWAMFWSMHSGILAAIAMVFARYTAYFVPLGDTGQRLAAIAALAVLSAVNYAGVRQGSAVQTAFTAIKVAALAGIIAMGIAAGGASGRVVAVTGATAPVVTTAGLFAAIVAGLFAFGGWHMVTYAAGETVQPGRTIPRALLIGTVIVTAAYIAVNAAYLAVLPMSAVAASSRVAADFADAVLGAGGAAAMSALVVISTLGALTGIILAGPRVYLAMSHQGLLFDWMGAIHPRFRTPHHAIVAQAIWASVLVATGSYRALFTRVVYTEWIFFGLMAASLFVLRRRPGYAPTTPVWGYPVLPAIFVISAAVIVIHQFVSQPAESAGGILLVLAGLPVYFWWTRRRTRSPEVRS